MAAPPPLKKPLLPFQILSVSLISSWLCHSVNGFIDLNGDQLDDVWQERFGAYGITADGDEDADDQTNLEECGAGTDPFDASSFHQFVSHELNDNGGMVVAWQSLAGKHYQLEYADTPSDADFTTVGPELPGTGDLLTVVLADDEMPDISGSVFHEIWADADLTNAISDAQDIAAISELSFDTNPSAVDSMETVKIPSNVGDNYYGRIRGFIKPSADGTYTFHIAGRGPCELWMSRSDDPNNILKIAEVLDSQLDIGEEEWTKYSNQSSIEIKLTAGEKVYIEVRHEHQQGADHCAVGWKKSDSDEITLLPKEVLCPFIDNQAVIGGINGDRKFFRLRVFDKDQDGDDISDWAEKQMQGMEAFFFADATTNSGAQDGDTLKAALANVDDPDLIELTSSDALACEDNAPFLVGDTGKLLITRSQGLQPISIMVASENVPAPDESAESADYELKDSQGSVVATVVTLGFGQLTSELELTALPDAIHEYPETFRLRLQAPADPDDYEVGLQEVADVLIYDHNDDPSNDTLFVGTFSLDGNATVPSSAGGWVSAVLNGTKTMMLVSDEFSNLTSPQQDSHIHKANPGNSPGSIIFEVIDEGGEPLNGPLLQHPWDLTESTGAVPTAGGPASRQTIIDSLFNQVGETKLYLNLHTQDNPAGECWAFFDEATGSINDPGDPEAGPAPGSAEFPQLTGQDLEVEVRRFLNQATFGANDAEVAALVATIENERISDANYHRVSAFEDWVDDQIDNIPQTYLVDFVLASDMQEWKLRGYFDPARNPGNGETNTPTLPAAWPSIDRSSANAEEWFPNVDYPLTNDEIRLGDNTNNIGEPNGNNRRRANWAVMVNAKDQLRQKMGFALQQIVVVSQSLNTFNIRGVAASNYQDQLNHNAFRHYRDILGFVNWSPVMGKWLSSLKNQKAFTTEEGTEVFPDENLARENMQLFSIGLFVLWADGSLKLGTNGLPIPTYTNTDIQEFAKVLTGQSFSIYSNNDQDWGVNAFSELLANTSFNRGEGNKYYGNQFFYPMAMFGDRHDEGVKTMAGGKVIDNTAIADLTQRGIQDIEDAIDWLAGKPGDGQPDFDMVHSHQSTPAFICRRLIQRFVTSNPSSEYLHRVATVFKDNEGDLRETIKAMLLDAEARVYDSASTSFGLKKSPLEGYIQLLRTFQAHSLLPLVQDTNPPFDTAPGDYSNPDIYLPNFAYPTAQAANFSLNSRYGYFNTHGGTGSSSLEMTPFAQETVFNWYLPDFSPGGPIAVAALVAPEMQLANEVAVIRNINYFWTVSVAWNPTSGASGQSTSPLGGTNDNQRMVFGQGTTAGPWDHNDRVRIDIQSWADTLYPATEPTATGSRTSESLADEALFDAMDEKLTLGRFKEQYPYDPSDDDDPSEPGVDDLLKNPREVIIDYITLAYGDPYNGNNDDSDRRNKFRFALYLMAVSPEYMVKK